MKAKEYAAMLTPMSDKAIKQVADLFLREINELSELRHAKSNAAMISILDEQDQKWQALARIVPVAPNGFDIIIESAFPDVYQIWRK